MGVSVGRLERRPGGSALWSEARAHNMIDNTLCAKCKQSHGNIILVLSSLNYYKKVSVTTARFRVVVRLRLFKRERRLVH